MVRFGGSFVRSLPGLAAGVIIALASGDAEGTVPGANGKIAFNSPRGCPAYFGCSSGNLYTIEPDGRSEAQLLPEEASDPAWSPDGRRLAFRALDPALHSFYIAVMNADGTDRRALDPPREPNSHDT